MIKTYVLDTNVLIQSPLALLSFEDNNIVLPISVLEELDDLKHADSERGANARQSIRFLEKLRQQGNLFEGVALETGGTLKIEANFAHIELPYGFHPEANDNRILKVCKGLAEQSDNIILVTKDILVRLKAQKMNIVAEDFTTEQSPLPSKQYTGRLEVYASDEAIKDFKRKGISPDQIYLYPARELTLSEGSVIFEKIPVALILNQYVIIHSESNEKKTLLGRWNGKQIVPLQSLNQTPFGVQARNAGQRFLQEALLADPKVAPLVIVKGPAGTAKTFYSLAVGLDQVLNAEKKGYRKILITRSTVQFDHDIGFLPGTEQEKIAPYLRPIMDNLEILYNPNESNKSKNEKEVRSKIDDLFSRRIINAEAINFIRGRSITNTYLIIDEAQNLTPKQVKGIVTRVGKGTKIILLGDPDQIDHPLLDERTNGLSYVSDRMKHSPLCHQITMLVDECERSELAWDAAKRM